MVMEDAEVFTRLHEQVFNPGALALVGKRERERCEERKKDVFEGGECERCEEKKGEVCGREKEW